MLRSYAPHGYAVGLNTPLAILYSVTARSGLPLAVRTVLVLLILACAVFEIVRPEARTHKSRNLIVITGTLFIWSMLLFVYNYVPETGNLVTYEIAHAVLVTGTVLVLVGMFRAYAAQKSKYPE